MLGEGRTAHVIYSSTDILLNFFSNVTNICKTSSVQDGTNLIDVASHLKLLHIIDVLGTPVDKGQTVVGKDTGFQVNSYNCD